MRIQSLLKTSVLGALIAFNLNVRAASITWSAPVAISSDANVSTTGTLAYAYCWSGTSTTVNGVNFTGTTSANSGGADVTLTGFGNNYTSFGNSPGSAAYQNMLAGADYNGSASATITFSNLIVGHVYVAQFWVGDWRNINTSRSETIKGSASDNITPTLNYQVGTSGSGTYVIGTFTASATTQTFTNTPGGSSPNVQINALQLRDLSILVSSITWNTSVTIAGDTDVSTTGTLAYAYCWSGTSTTVNGVNFTGTTSPNSGGTDVTLTGFGNNFSSYLGNGSASFSTAYQNMLAGADWNGSAGTTITFRNLTIGHIYVAQFWVGDWRNYNTVRNETIKSSASDNITPTLNYQVGTNGSGSFVIGSFTAAATTQPFTLIPGGSSPSVQINALQLRDLSPPVSSIWTNLSGGSWPVTNNWSNSVAAYGIGATAWFNTLTLTANATVTLDGARTIGNLFFDDKNATKHGWTLNTGTGDPLTLAVSNGVPVISNNVATAIGAVLSGTGGLTKTGSGTLTLSATNIYTGGTTVSAGTLQLGDGATRSGSVSGAITNNGALIIANPTAQLFASTITGTGGFTKTGAGTLTLSSSNSYQGVTTISTGTLRLLATQLPSGLQIMPLGDSITYGAFGSDAGYRGFLYNLLNPIAPNFQFVGASTVNPGSLPTNPIDETHHNGYSSYATLDLLNNLDGLDLTRYNQYGGAERYPNGGYWLTGGNGTGRSAVFPDIILLLVGANDIAQANLGNTNINIVNYPTNLTALINELVTLRPNAKVLTADITPEPTQSANAATINSMVHTVVTNFQAQGAHVSEADLFTQFPANGISGDDLHPNDTGYTFMAGQWYNSILAVYPGISSCIPSNSTVTIAANATLDLNGNQATIGGLTGGGNVALGNGGILNITISNGVSTTFNGVISGSGALTKTGSGSVTLTGTNLYNGATTVSNGALALNSSGSISNSSNISIAAGATFDVSAIATFNLSSSNRLMASGTGATVGSAAAEIKGGTTVRLRTNSVTLIFTPIGFNGDTTHPALLVSQGALTITNSSITVSNASGTALGAGSYRLIQVTGGTLNGPSNSTITVTGSGIISGSTASLSVSSGNLNLVVSTATTTTTLTRTVGSTPSTYGGTLTFHAVVSPDPGNGSTIIFSTNGVAFGTAPTTGGAADLTSAANVLKYSGGSAYTVTAVFGGNVNYVTSSGTLSGGQQVNKAAVTISSGLTANNKVYDGTTTATISSNTVGLAGVLAGDTGNVSLPTNGYAAAFASATVGNGKTVTVSGLALTGSAAGNYTLTQPTLSANLTAASTLNVVTSSLNPAATGSNVTFTATLNVVSPGAGTPTGNVIFKDGVTAFGTNALNGSALASFSNAALSHGSHTITAEYAGDGNFFGSTNTLNQVMNSSPVATANTLQRAPNCGLNVRVATLLANDTDPDGDALTFISVSATSASGGTNAVHGNWISYTPPAGFMNADSFSYTIADSGGLQATGTVSITILADSAPAQNIGGIDNPGNGSSLIHFSEIPGHAYTVQYTTNLVTPNWQSLATNTADAFGKIDFTDSPATNSPPRFYRSTNP